MPGLMLNCFLLFGWPLVVPAVFLFTHGGHMTSRGLFYVIGVLVSYGASFAGPIIWGFMLGFVGAFLISNSDFSEQAIESAFTFAFPVHMGVTWVLLPSTCVGVILSVAALKLLAKRFERIEPSTSGATDAAASPAGPA